MLKVQIEHARITVGGQYITEGSVLAGTIQASVPRIWSKLPTSVATKLGPSIVRYLP